jgi:outer membrane protein TolC
MPRPRSGYAAFTRAELSTAGRIWWVILVGMFATGCSRTFYRHSADCEAYTIIESRTADTPWYPSGFTIDNAPDSRLYDPTPRDYPILPDPEPQLNTYTIPPLQSNALRKPPASKAEVLPKPERATGPNGKSEWKDESQVLPEPASEPLPLPAPGGEEADGDPKSMESLPESDLEYFDAPQKKAPKKIEAPREEHEETDEPNSEEMKSEEMEEDTEDERAIKEPGAASVSRPVSDKQIRLANYSLSSRQTEPAETEMPEEITPEGNEAEPDESLAEGMPVQEPQGLNERSIEQLEEDLAVAEGQVPLSPLAAPPIAKDQWDSLPRASLARMLEFTALSDEYARSFGQQPSQDLVTSGPDLTLENVIELGLLNSREYQTQKEALYRAALEVSLARYDFALKATPFVNGTDLDFFHTQQASHTEKQLRIAQVTQWDKTLATSGTILARLANNILITFDGPQGFASDISSQLLLDWTQPIFQRDIRLEPLTAAERRLLYAVRTYARYRKIFFVQLATQYYTQLRAYRQIAIESQNYFSLSRALRQARAELETPQGSRIQTEQIEQNMLASRGRLISACVSLDRSQDQFKILLGLPTELAMRLNLEELDAITIRDTASVSADAVLRTRSRLTTERERRNVLSAEMINAAVVLHQRSTAWRTSAAKNRQEDGTSDSPDAEDSQDSFGQELESIGLRLLLADAQLNVALRTDALATIQQGADPSVVRLLQRRVELIAAFSGEIARQLDVIRASSESDKRSTADVAKRHQQLRQEARDLWIEQARLLQDALLDDLTKLAETADGVLEKAKELAREASELNGAASESILTEQGQQVMLTLVDQLLILSERALSEEMETLPTVDISVNDAMMTALSLRLDLMNERGGLADDRRAIKLAADDLKSVLNLRARETMGVRIQQPGDTTEFLQTQVGVSLDLPLNRKAQRNLYRTALINYQVGRRSLMALEDTIKFAVRDDLRNLTLAKTQYQIGVASAALANERVNSTRLALALGIPGVAARDFLEAQDAFRLAVGGVADNHIGYLVNRMQLFLDLEVMQLDDTGFWLGLKDEGLQPSVQNCLSPEAGPPYGPLVPWLHYSREIRSIHGLP